MKTSIDSSELEAAIAELGKEIFSEVEASSSSRLSADYWGDQLMQWAMDDKAFKVSLFRFVGVFPDLSNSRAIVQHAQEYFTPVSEHLPGVLKQGLKLNPKSLSAKLGAQVIRKQIGAVASRFILGENPKRALSKLYKLRNNNIAFTIDLLGEAAVSEAESEDYLKRYLELLEILSSKQSRWSKPLIEGHRGERTPINISVKLSALYSQAKPVSTERSIEVLAERLTKILIEAKKHEAYVYLDMEDTALTSIIIETFKKVLSESEFKDYDRVGLVLQAYLRRTEADLLSLIEWSKDRGAQMGVRLVKGAYWDTESALAMQHDWPIPVWQDKVNSDATFERLTRILLSNSEVVYPAFASHNTRSLCHAVQVADALGVPKEAFELQMLYGMAEPIKQAFLKRGFLIRDYAPIGELIPGMGYLVRRLLENTSNEGFLRLRFHENETPETLFSKPHFNAGDTGENHLRTNYRDSFSNVPLQDFSLPAVRASFVETLSQAMERLRISTETVSPIISGECRETSDKLPSICPDDRSFALAVVNTADIEMAEQAISDLKAYFPEWRATPIAERQEVLFRAAEIMEERRNELAAIIVMEASKQWVEADADVAEAIDFLNYYAHEAAKLFEKEVLGNFPGEFNQSSYEPRGVTLVISPWNFPLAIPCGMLSAALVTGNCAILKPAEQSSLIAQKLFEILLEAGLPPQAATFLPALGETVGAHLVKHDDISTIVFTGSKEVGLDIIHSAAITKPGQEHVKRVIAEMGGKNAIIIDEDADLDEAVKGVTYSAFGFQGQKCSACSRVIVVSKATYKRFAKRFSEATRSVEVGPAWEPSSFVSSVIDREQFERISDIIERSKESLTLLAEGKPPAEGRPDGCYIRPTVFSDVASDHFLLKTEVFGPVVTLEVAESFDEAIQMALDSEYALTGAVYSRSPRNIDYATREFRVGNLYINRGSTGALVARQPFGGAKMSGVGSKAGGVDYLRQFVIPRTITENTMRRGFTPDL